MTIRLVTEADIGMPLLLRGKLLMPYSQTCILGVARDFKGGVLQVSALYDDVFLPIDSRALADTLDALQKKDHREGQSLGSLIARAKAELYELAGVDLTQIDGALSLRADPLWRR